jgi:DNA-binding LacI/PurR family transcriptional regulator
MDDPMVAGTTTSESRVSQVAERIRAAISNGTHPPNTKLPAYRQLATTYGVSIWTVKAALDVLESEGLVQRHERSGTFVMPKLRLPQNAVAPTTLQCVNIVTHYSPDECHPQYRPFLSDFLTGCTDALEDHHIKMRFVTLPRNRTEYETLLSPAHTPSEQAFLLNGVRDVKFIEWLSEHSMPFVVCYHSNYSHAGYPPHNVVFKNKMAGTFEAVSYLVQLGHSRIGFMGHTKDGRDPATQHEGYCAGMRVAGLEPCASDQSDYWSDTIDVDIAPAATFLQKATGLTALVAQTDATALCCMKAARSLGIGVPDELSIIGCNDQAEAATATPPLTTITVPRRQSAMEAMKLLLEVAEDTEGAVRTRAIPCTLVLRETTAPPHREEDNSENGIL